MNMARQIASLNDTQTLNYDFFLDNLAYCLDKGKGFSLLIPTNLPSNIF